MIFGMTVANFIALHVVISVVAIFAGFIVVGGMFSNAGLAGWTAFFLATTLLTNITGFMFPLNGLTPALAVGLISTLFLVVALIALYVKQLTGIWRAVYVVTAMVGLYLNVFVFIVQSFQKVSFLNPFAPKGTEPPFVIAQAVALIVFVLLGWMALRAFHPRRVVM
jgi:hypothetical protein